MSPLQGVIHVADIIEEDRRRQQVLKDWQERSVRTELRREEQQVLREWWRASEKDRPEIVRRHKDVFARIRENRKRAHQIAATERAISDAAMRRQGYLVRTNGELPRYVRPERAHLYPAHRRSHYISPAPLPAAGR